MIMNKKMSGIIFIFILMMTGCQKNIYFPIQPAGIFSVNEKLATPTQPAQFYLCGNNCYPCQKNSNRWSGHHKAVKKNVHMKIFKNTKENVHEKNIKAVKCSCK